MKNRKYKREMYKVLITNDHYEYEETLNCIISSVRNELKELKPHELHLGHGSIIDMSNIYNHHELDDDWQHRDDGSGEYRDTIYYSYDAERVLTLIGQDYAELSEINTDGDETKYFFRMRRNY